MNSITVKKKFGADEYTIHVESDSILEAMEKITVFSQVDKCDKCGGNDLYISYRKATPKEGKNAGKSFSYYDFVCRTCGAKANIGMYQTGGIFLKRFEKYGEKAETVTDNPNVAAVEEPARAPWEKPASTVGQTGQTKLGNNPPRF